MTPGTPSTPWRIAQAASQVPAAASSGRMRAVRSHDPACTDRLAIRSITAAARVWAARFAAAAPTAS